MEKSSIVALLLCWRIRPAPDVLMPPIINDEKKTSIKQKSCDKWTDFYWLTVGMILLNKNMSVITLIGLIVL